MDKVFIEQLEAEAIIGTYGHEQSQYQPLIFDLEMYGDFSQAAASDQLDQAIDYAQVTEQVRQFCLNRHFQLLEALVSALMDMLLANFGLIEELSITVRKPLAVKQATVGVSLNRKR